MPYLQGKVPGDIHPQWQPSWVTSTEDHCILECFFFRDPPPSRGSEWGMWRIGAVVQLRRSLRRCLWVSSAALNGSPACCQAAPWRVYPVQTPSSKTLPGTRDNTRLEETCILGKEMNPPLPHTHIHTKEIHSLKCEADRRSEMGVQDGERGCSPIWGPACFLEMPQPWEAAPGKDHP